MRNERDNQTHLGTHEQANQGSSTARPRLRLITRLLIVVVLLTAASVAAVLFFRSLKASFSYGLLIEFTALPANDQKLEAWLKVQPGIVSRTVYIKRDETRLGIMFIMVQTVTGKPSVPDLLGQCERLGYRGRKRVYWDFQGDGDFHRNAE